MGSFYPRPLYTCPDFMFLLQGDQILKLPIVLKVLKSLIIKGHEASNLITEFQMHYSRQRLISPDYLGGDFIKITLHKIPPESCRP